MKVGSLFSGAGGFDLAAQLADPDYEIEWQVEIDPYCRSVLRRKFPGVPLFKDVRDVGRSNLSGVDCVAGGFPCQDYSIAGGRSGLAGDRGAVWWEMHRIIASCSPTWIVGENVPGMLSSRGGRDFLEIVRSLIQLGYGVTWSTLDSQFWNVPQRRRRLFIIGHSGGVPRPEILTLSEGVYGHPDPSGEKGKDATKRVTPSLTSSGTGTSRVGFNSEDQRVVLASGTSKATAYSRVAHTLTKSDYKGPGHNRDENIVGGDIPRRLTPRECERLQGFPDDWTRYADDNTEISDSQRYKMMGNAITVPVAEFLFKRIKDAD
jgi:DNA (cytosine-5)-methyltransferase 1